MNELMIESHLRRDERVLWTGQPDHRRIFSMSDLFMVPFSLFWCGFALFWESLALGIGTGKAAPSFFAVFGLPFVLIGLYMLVGRFFFKNWSRRRTYYAVTNQRVLIVREFWGGTTDMIYFNAIPTLSTSVHADGSGTLVLHPDTSQGSRRTPTPFQLEDVPNVRGVEEIVEDARKAALAEDAPRAAA